jgi:hypothetical protein
MTTTFAYTLSTEEIVALERYVRQQRALLESLLRDLQPSPAAPPIFLLLDFDVLHAYITDRPTRQAAVIDYIFHQWPHPFLVPPGAIFDLLAYLSKASTTTDAAYNAQAQLDTLTRLLETPSPHPLDFRDLQAIWQEALSLLRHAAVYAGPLQRLQLFLDSTRVLDTPESVPGVPPWRFDQQTYNTARDVLAALRPQVPLSNLADAYNLATILAVHQAIDYMSEITPNEPSPTLYLLSTTPTLASRYLWTHTQFRSAVSGPMDVLKHPAAAFYYLLLADRPRRDTIDDVNRAILACEAALATLRDEPLAPRTGRDASPRTRTDAFWRLVRDTAIMDRLRALGPYVQDPLLQELDAEILDLELAFKQQRSPVTTATVESQVDTIETVQRVRTLVSSLLFTAERLLSSSPMSPEVTQQALANTLGRKEKFVPQLDCTVVELYDVLGSEVASIELYSDYYSVAWLTVGTVGQFLTSVNELRRRLSKDDAKLQGSLYLCTADEELTLPLPDDDIDPSILESTALWAQGVRFLRINTISGDFFYDFHPVHWPEQRYAGVISAFNLAPLIPSLFYPTARHPVLPGVLDTELTQRLAPYPAID